MEMMTMNIEDAKRIISDNEELSAKVLSICDFLTKMAYSRVDVPLSKGDISILKRGIVYPSHGIEIAGDDEETAVVKVSAWDGYDGEPFDNTVFSFPFKWLNMDNPSDIIKEKKDGQ